MRKKEQCKLCKVIGTTECPKAGHFPNKRLLRERAMRVMS